jgi:hypothetical protein
MDTLPGSGREDSRDHPRGSGSTQEMGMFLIQQVPIARLRPQCGFGSTREKKINIKIHHNSTNNNPRVAEAPRGCMRTVSSPPGALLKEHEKKRRDFERPATARTPRQSRRPRAPPPRPPAAGAGAAAGRCHRRPRRGGRTG